MLLKVVIVLVTLAYPFMVYWGVQRFDASLLLPLLGAVLLLRWLAGNSDRDRKVILVSVVGVVLVTLMAGAQQGLMFYPVLVSLGMLVVFGSSLFAQQTIIEKLARLKEPDLAPRAVAYTRTVTKVWCGFFVVNGSLSLFTIFSGSEQLWLLYNGLISYMLIGLLVVGEWLVRHQIKRKL